MTEREKMLAGGWFDPRDAELTAIRDNATRLMHRLNVELCGHDDAYRAALDSKRAVRSPSATTAGWAEG